MFRRHTCRSTQENTYKIRTRRNLSSDNQKTLEKIHAKRTCHSCHDEKCVKTRTTSSSRFVPSAINYRILENSYTKNPSQKICEAEICKKLEKLHRKRARDERGQNATPVEETPCNHSMSDPPSATQALKMRPLSRKRCVTAQKALRRRFLSKKPHLGAQRALSRKRYASAQMRPLPRKRHLGAQKTIPVDEIAPACSECEPCRINCICALRMINTAEIVLGTNIGFVTTDLHAKYRRNRIGNEHRVCNH